MRISLTAVLLAALLPIMSLAQPETAAPALVSTTGSAKVYAEPDEVHFSININVEADGLVAAKTENAKLASKAILYLKEQGVEERYIQTQYLNVSVQYRDRMRMEPRYFANQTIRVCLKAIDRYESINMGLLERGITGIQGPDFKTSQLETLRAKARTQAVLDAREKATAMAEALGQTIGPAFRIDDAKQQGGGQPLYARSMSMDAEMASDGGGVATGELTISHEVTVSFFLLR